MSFDYHSDNTTSGPTDSATRPSPGKRARTDDLPAGSGAMCETPSAAGCALTAEERRDLTVKLGFVVLTSMDNYRDAINDLRTDFKMVPPVNLWSFGAEIIFGLASTQIVAALTRGVMFAALRGAGEAAHHGFDRAAITLTRIEAEHVKGVVTQASKGARTALKNAAHGHTGDDVIVAFLELVREQIKPTTDGIILGAMDLADIELQGMFGYYHDAGLHSVAKYKADLRELISRYLDNGIPQIGEVSIFQHGELRWVVDRGGSRKRLVLLRSHGLDHHPADGVHPTDLAFVRVVDKDFEGLAVDIYQERRGRKPDTHDIDTDERLHEATWLTQIWREDTRGLADEQWLRDFLTGPQARGGGGAS